ncbi:hypothetical protein C6P44_005385 [Monosporozyma unispora]|nr:hypothetical protein C6P44_005385 [Kazachstania unispora]
MVESVSTRSQIDPTHAQGSGYTTLSLGPPTRRSRRNGHSRRAPRFNFKKQMDLEGSNYDVITSVAYLNEKYGLRESHYIEKFIKCIHRKINMDASKISHKYVESLDPWVKSKLFLLLVTLSERGGPEYWIDKEDQKNDKKDAAANPDGSKTNKKITNDSSKKNENKSKITNSSSTTTESNSKTNSDDSHYTTTLTEHIIQQNINQDFTESIYDENYVFSSIWANFMEGLINHYLEKIIVPHSEMKVCQQLYKPMMKIISLYNEYNELIEKSERNGFLPTPTDDKDEANQNLNEDEEKEPESSDYSLTLASIHEVTDKSNDLVSQERLERAQKLLWQARQDIPKTISKELTLLSEMYSTLSADEQDYELDEFVCCAEEYIESEFLPGLVNVLFANCGTNAFWKVLLVLEPFFYYIEDVGESDEEDMDDSTTLEGKYGNDKRGQSFKPDPRVITLEKICEVAAKQKWI